MTRWPAARTRVDAYAASWTGEAAAPAGPALAPSDPRPSPSPRRRETTQALRIGPMLAERGATGVAPLVVAAARRPGSRGQAHVLTKLGVRQHGDVVTSGQLAQ